MSDLKTELQRIYDENRHLTPQLVVAAARDPLSPLHAQFEWDDSVAGEKYREQQAQHLIRRVKIVYRTTPEGEEKKVRAWVAVPQDDALNRVYMPTEEALSDDFTRRLLLKDMEREWLAFRRRYEHMAEFAAMVAEYVNGRTA